MGQGGAFRVMCWLIARRRASCPGPRVGSDVTGRFIYRYRRPKCHPPSNEKMPRSNHGAEQSPFALDTFEEMATAVLEFDAGACHEVLYHARD